MFLYLKKMFPAHWNHHVQRKRSTFAFSLTFGFWIRVVVFHVGTVSWGNILQLCTTLGWSSKIETQVLPLHETYIMWGVLGASRGFAQTHMAWTFKWFPLTFERNSKTKKKEILLAVSFNRISFSSQGTVLGKSLYLILLSNICFLYKWVTIVWLKDSIDCLSCMHISK